MPDTFALASGLGLNGTYPTAFAQLGDKVFFANGYDPLRFLYLKNRTVYEAGFQEPAAPSGTPTSTGLTGTYMWRVRWRDAATETIGPPGPAFSANLANQIYDLTRPSLPATGRAPTHWILERTVGGGTVFFPVNGLDGTPVATATLTDAVLDNDGITFNRTIGEFQGKPGVYPLLAGTVDRLFAGGGIVVQLDAVTVTDTSATVTGPDGSFTPDMVGSRFFLSSAAHPDLYTVEAWVSDTEITLDRAFSGTSDDYSATIAAPGNVVAWSESGQPEWWGQTAVGTLQNVAKLGDEERLTALAALTTLGGATVILYCKATRVYLHTYTLGPNLDLGGQIIELPDRRGALGSRCVLVAEGVCYGMDDRGPWRYQPGGQIEDIGAAIHGDFRNGTLNMENAAGEYERWFIQWRPELQQVAFWVREQYGDASRAHPTMAYLWDARRSAWVGTERPGNSRTAAVVLNLDGPIRAGVFSFQDGVELATLWAQGAGYIDASEKYTGAVTAVSGSTLTLDAAALNTSVVGSAVRLDYADTTFEWAVIVARPASDQITIGGFAGMPDEGTVVTIGAIAWRLRSGRMDCGQPGRLKTFRSLRFRAKRKTYSGLISLRFFINGEKALNSDRLNLTESGLMEGVQADPTSGWYRFDIPLGLQAYDLAVEFYGRDANYPAEIYLPAELVAEVDDVAESRRN